MSAFLERYGISIFVIIIIGIMVLVASPLGLKVEDLVEKEIQKFADTAGSESWENDNNEDPVTLIGEAYAIYSEDDNSLTFIRAEVAPVVGETYDGKIIDNVYADIETTNYYFNTNNDKLMPEWNQDETAYLVEIVEFKDVIKPISTYYWFGEFYSLTNITGLKNLNTENVTDMACMFNWCSELTELDVSGFNTSNVIYMEEMFANCRNLKSLDISNFNTNNVINMSYMFKNCSKIENLDVSKWNTSNVTDMSDMFRGCNNLSVICTYFDVSNVTNMGGMFASIGSNLTTFNIGDLSNWDVSNVTNMDQMFSSAGRNANYTLDLSAWKDKVGKVKYHNSFDSGVESKVISPWD